MKADGVKPKHDYYYCVSTVLKYKVCYYPKTNSGEYIIPNLKFSNATRKLYLL